MNKILLDTNAYTQLLVGEHKIIDAVAAADIIFVSVTSLGELFAGFKYGSKEAEVYAQIYTTLRKAGTLIPTNDMWIAAQALETEAKLITLDDHFSKIPGVRIWGQTLASHTLCGNVDNSLYD